MISRFTQYLVEEERVAYFVFATMNPPHINDGKLLDKLAKTAGKGSYMVYLSHSADGEKNPLSYSDKIKYARKMFPRHARSIIVDKKCKTPKHVLTKLYDQGYKNVVMVSTKDRVNEYNARLNAGNGKKGSHGFYNFENGISIVSAGNITVDSSKAIKEAVQNNFVAFSQGLGDKITNTDSRKLFNSVRGGLGLKENTSFQHHVQLNKVSDRREEFVTGTLFELGDTVVVKESEEIGKIVLIGSNYLIIECGDKKLRKWIDAVEPIEEDNKKSMYADKPDWGTDASAKKAKKITPNEETDPMASARDTIQKDKSQARDMIAKEKEKDKKKHDRILDAARRQNMLRKNKGVQT
jgi:hypothetical protein